MTSWRMQLHPNQAGKSAEHATRSLSAGFIGLDFREDVGDLESLSKSELETNEKVYWYFAHEMEVGDHVLIYVHNYPFALVSVDGPYNYIKHTVPEIGVWFRHFRRVKEVRYYSDYVTNPKNWDGSVMAATITPLRKDTPSQRLITQWLDSTSE